MYDSIYTIKNGYGRYTYLDKIYNRLIRNNTTTLDEDTLKRWSTYNQIMVELLDSKRVSDFEEVKYRLTDGENPNVVILDILYRTDLIFEHQQRQIDILESYIDEDQFGHFYK